MSCSYGPTYRTVTSGGRPSGNKEEGNVVIRSFGPNVPLGRGGCDSAVKYGKVVRFWLESQGPT